DANAVALYTLPTAPEEIEGAQVLILRDDDAQPYLDRINGVEGATIPEPGSPTATTPTTVAGGLAPSDVDIRVLNGEGTPGAAARAATALEGAGFTVSGTGDSAAVPRTTIRHSAAALGAA